MKKHLCYARFGAAIKRRRKLLDINQETLAKKVKMSRGSIANIETGRQKVLLEQVFVFADALLWTPEKLFRRLKTGGETS